MCFVFACFIVFDVVLFIVLAERRVALLGRMGRDIIRHAMIRMVGAAETRTSLTNGIAAEL